MRRSRIGSFARLLGVLVVVGSGCSQDNTNEVARKQPSERTERSERLPKMAVNGAQSAEFDEPPAELNRRSSVRQVSSRPLSTESPSSAPRKWGSWRDRDSRQHGRLDIALENETLTGEPLSEKAETRWRDVLTSLGGRRSLLKVVDDPKEADWVVQVAAPERTDIVYVRPGGDSLEEIDDETLIMIPPGDTKALRAQLESIARAYNLIQFAEEERKKEDQPVKIDVELRELEDHQDKTGKKIELKPGLVLNDGKLIGLYVNNRNRFPVNVTVLFIDAHYRIHALYPREEGQTGWLDERDSFMPMRATVKDDGKGFERMVVLAVEDKSGKDESDSEPTDFTFLAKPERTVEIADSTPLQRMISTTLYRDGGRGSDDDDSDSKVEGHAFRVISWRTTEADEGERAFGFFRKGSADDLKAEIVNEQNSSYHTANRMQAVLGTYGKFVKGNKLANRMAEFEHRGIIEHVDRARRFTTVQRRGRNSGKDFLSFCGNRQAWQVVDLAGKVGGGTNHNVEFEIVGQRLDQTDVIRALNADREALAYFDYLHSKGEVPCVVVENIVMTNYSATRGNELNLDASAKVPNVAGAGAQYDRRRESTSTMVSPIIRCYQMYEVKQHQNQVVELVSRSP